MCGPRRFASAGHPEGRKPTALREAGLTVHAPNGQKKALAEHVAQIHRLLESVTRPVLVGSSYGGLAVLAVARDTSHPLAGVVLCAPALIWSEQPAGAPEGLIAPPGTVVLHGTRDTIIPLDASRALVARSPGCRLIELDDDHRLACSLEILVAEVRGRAASPG